MKFIPPLRAQSHSHFTSQYRFSSYNTDEVHAPTAGPIALMKTFMTPLRAYLRLHFTSQYQRSCCNTDEEVHAPAAGSNALTKTFTPPSAGLVAPMKKLTLPLQAQSHS
jgi:hypothetical protein